MLVLEYRPRGFRDVLDSSDNTNGTCYACANGGRGIMFSGCASVCACVPCRIKVGAIDAAALGPFKK